MEVTVLVPIAVALIVSIIAPQMLARSVNKRADAMAILAAADRAGEKKAEAEIRAEEKRVEAEARAAERRDEAEAHRAEKQQDWDREDLVAAQLKADAAAALEISLLSAEKLDANLKVSNATHELANSHFTAQMKITLAATRVSLELMKEATNGDSKAELIEATEATIKELEDDIAERLEATTVAAEQLNPKEK